MTTATTTSGMGAAIAIGATKVGTTMAMCPSRKGFGEGWARMTEGSEKQESPFYSIGHRFARGLQNAALFTRVQVADLS